MSLWPLAMLAFSLASLAFCAGWVFHALVARADRHTRTVDLHRRRLAAVERAATPRPRSIP